MTTYEGSLQGAGLRIGDRVLRASTTSSSTGCWPVPRSTLVRHGVAEDDITVAWVPGIVRDPGGGPAAGRPQVRSTPWSRLGAVIRGATAHFEHVAGQAAAGVQRAALDTGVPVIFGVLTTDTIEQAIERAGTKLGNKGSEAAVAAIEMATLLKELPGG